MPRRSSPRSDGSLDLLLDTICNAFGGVLFIALLVILLIQTTTDQVGERPITVEQELALIERQTALLEAEAQLADLRSTRDTSDRLVATLTTPGSQQAAERLRQTQLELDAVSRDVSHALADLAAGEVGLREAQQAEADARQRQTQAIEHQQARAELEARITQKVQALEQAQAVRTRRAGVGGGTFFEDRRYFSFLVRHGRLYQVDDPLMPLSDEVEKRIEGRTTVIRPRSGQGLHLDASENTQRLVRQRLERVSSTRYVLRFWIWEDSFEAWATIESVLENLPHKRDIELMRAESDIIIVTGPAARAFGE